MTTYADISRRVIERVALSISDDAPLKERKALIEAAYPFDAQAYWPRRAWNRVKKAYLSHWAAPNPPLFAHLERDPVTGRPVIK